MRPAVRFLLAALFSAASAAGWAQKPKPVPAGQPMQKYKPPKLTSSLGLHSDSATVPMEEARQLVNLPLKITDDKKNLYSISSYQLLYKKAGVTEVEKPDKIEVVPSFTTHAQLFRETPITGTWKKSLAEQLKPGDELFFFDIIVKDAQGRLMFAPELNIRVR
ncbi:MAG TPA: hypothetical protein PLZ45_10165 [Ferruginibacter sp.]|nr:hypothetical protein [Ferruginibacter sp.]